MPKTSKEHRALLEDLIQAIQADTLKRIERELGIAMGLRNFAREQLDYWKMQLAYSAEEIKIYGNEKARRTQQK